jgi:HxlR-like helix-turn-helix
MLGQQLKAMEADGIVLQTAYPQVPPKVEYSLTAWGQSLCPALDAILKWADRRPAHVRKVSGGAGQETLHSLAPELLPSDGQTGSYCGTYLGFLGRCELRLTGRWFVGYWRGRPGGPSQRAALGCIQRRLAIES